MDDNMINLETPTPLSTDSIVNTVVNNFLQRSKIGIEKYGTTLDRKDLTIINWIDHAIEESMDHILYLTKLKQELLNKDNM